MARTVGEDIWADLAVEHVKGGAPRPALTVDDMIDRRRAGIPDAALKAAVTK